MVLRKPPPPGIDAFERGNGRSEPLSPSSPTSPSSPATPNRLTRPPRARSSPQSPQTPAPASVYSPDLNTSPAFDLMPLDQAQRSPVAASFKEPRNPWADDLVEGPQRSSSPSSVQAGTSTEQREEAREEFQSETSRVPSILVSSTQRTQAAEDLPSNQPQDTSAGYGQPEQRPLQLQSNNPFLRVRKQSPNPWEDHGDHARRDEGGSDQSPYPSGLSPDDSDDRLSQTEGFIPMTAHLSLIDPPEPESPWAQERCDSNLEPPPQPSQTYPQRPQHAPEDGSTPWSSQTFDSVTPTAGVPDGTINGAHREPHAQPAAGTQESHVTTDHADHNPSQPKEQSVYEKSGPESRIDTPSLSNVTPNSSQDLLQFDEVPKAETETKHDQTASSVPPESRPSESREPQETHLLDQQDSQAPPSNEVRPVEEKEHPPAPAQPAPLSDAELARQKEQKSETYAIRHINWTDHTGKLRESPVLVQNKNGPCPLLALVNGLVMRAEKDAQPPIVRALQTRENISLGLLIEALFDELTTCLGPDEELPDIEALSRFLTMLHTGMNVNPRLTLESKDAVGSFLETNDIRLYSTFKLPLIHGWLADPSTEAHAALSRVAQYHEDIQLLHFRKEELEDRVFRGGSLTPEEEKLMQDIHTIQTFVNVENATQLSVFGLSHLEKTLAPGSISILFRNDHFSTIYKHPQSHQLFTLVTDAGYANHAEIVWECLVDVNGFNAEFFAGDFRPVGNAPSGPPNRAGHPVATNGANHVTGSSVYNSRWPSQEQTDADYAYALSLQLEEEARRERAQNHHRRASSPYYQYPAGHPASRAAHNRSSSSIGGSGRYATGRAPGRQGQNCRPLVPPRNARNVVPPVNQHVDGPDDAPPPSYEQAANGPPYIPPPGHPHHEASSQENISPPYSGPSGNPNPALGRSRTQVGRRPPGASAPAGQPERPKEKSRDCVVM